jgi:hypothetical protein
MGKVLVIIKDIVEFKTLMNTGYISRVGVDNEVEIISPYKINLERNIPCKHIDIDVDKIDKIRYFLFLQGYFWRHRGVSNSSLQMFLYNNLVFPWRQGNNSKKSTFFFYVMKFFYYLIKKTIKNKNKRIQAGSLLKCSGSINYDKFFDKVILGRYYSLDTKYIVDALVLNNSEIIIECFCRSDDTPDTKGPPTITPDTMLFSNYFQKKRFDLLFTSEKYKNYKIISNEEYDINSINNNKSYPKKILYATSDVFLNPFEFDNVKSISKIKNPDIELVIRPIFCDNRKWDNFENISIQKSSYKEPWDEDTLHKLHSDLCEYLLIVSSTSTIVMEAKHLGIESIFVNINPNMEWILEREHLKYAKQQGIQVITDVKELEIKLKALGMGRN